MRVVLELPEGDPGFATVRLLVELLGIAWSVALRRAPLPPLYQSGVRYEPESNAGQYEDFKPPRRTFEDGFGDCDDLVIWRIAELRARGEPATVQVMRLRGTNRMHVRVRRANGKIEDPSILLDKVKTCPKPQL